MLRVLLHATPNSYKPGSFFGARRAEPLAEPGRGVLRPGTWLGRPDRHLVPILQSEEVQEVRCEMRRVRASLRSLYVWCVQVFETFLGP